MKINVLENHIENMIIEVTRECNFACAHCLRGEAQKVNLQLEKLKEFFQKNKIDRISSLTLTGGEPLMKPEIIENIVDIFSMNNIEIGNYYIATNGSYFNMESLNALSKLHNYCDDNEISYIEISNSPWHQEERERLSINYFPTSNEDFYYFYQEQIIDELNLDPEDEDTYYDTIDSKFSEYQDFFNEIKIGLDSREYKSLINQGRAESNGMGNRKESERSTSLTEDENMLYFSSKGEIILNNCDLSFKSIRKQKIQ